MNYPTTIKNLIEGYKKLPGIGEKTAERLALASLEIDDEILETFSESLKNCKIKIKKCKRCNNLSEEDECLICKDKTRDTTTICLVEDVKNIISLEKVGTYHGLYHVLGGLVSPLDGVNPEDLNIESLIKRVEKEKIKEVIIAIKPGIEGEMTSLYIIKKLANYNVKVSKIAYGIPIGADMDYLDALTLEMALEDRKEVS